MKALQMIKYGDITSSLKFNETPMPTVAADQVLIKVHAASVNPIDYKVLQGQLKAVKKINFPDGIGRDVSGEVSAIGANVSGISIGDAVFARVNENAVGTLAEYIAVDADLVAQKPDTISHNEAASIPLVGLTNHQALFDIAALQSGEKVLIHAGSGGIGALAIQMAKAKGAYVATTTSTANVDWVKKLGADEVIDYKTQDYRQIIRDYDVVFDTLGGQFTLDAFQVIKPSGRVVSINGVVDGQTAKEIGVPALFRPLLALQARKVNKAAKKKSAKYRFVMMKPNGKQLAALATQLEQGELKAIIDRTFKFEQSIDALNYLSKGRAKGKVVVSFTD